MKHPDVMLRNFKKTDEEMLQQAEVKLASFNEHKGRFTELFPNLADPFADDWALTIVNARAQLPDYASVAVQSGETSLLQALMDQGRTLYQSVLLYAQIAFPKNAALLKLLGQPQYNAARDSQLKLPGLMRAAYSVASKPENKAGLLASGMKETDIELLDTLAQRILDQNLAQEKARKNRSVDSGQRIQAMNAVYEKMSLVCQCSKLVFQDNAVLYSLFLIDGGSSTVAAPEAKKPTPVSG